MAAQVWCLMFDVDTMLGPGKQYAENLQGGDFQ